jgi:tRNA(fMet)-specific endonuclease VapC
MPLIIDSNRFIDLCTDRPGVKDMLESTDRVFLPFVVIAEIRVGFELNPRLEWQTRSLLAFTSRQGVSVAHSTDETCRHYAALFARLRRAGTPIPTNDIWLAALALEHRATIYSADTHFNHLPEISRIP